MPEGLVEAGRSAGGKAGGRKEKGRRKEGGRKEKGRRKDRLGIGFVVRKGQRQNQKIRPVRRPATTKH